MNNRIVLDVNSFSPGSEICISGEGFYETDCKDGKIFIRPKWLSVEHVLPQQGEYVLAWDGEEIQKACIEELYCGLAWTYYDWLEWKGVTHWIPLPKGPE